MAYRREWRHIGGSSIGSGWNHHWAELSLSAAGQFLTASCARSTSDHTSSAPTSKARVAETSLSACKRGRQLRGLIWGKSARKCEMPA